MVKRWLSQQVSTVSENHKQAPHGLAFSSPTTQQTSSILSVKTALHSSQGALARHAHFRPQSSHL